MEFQEKLIEGKYNYFKNNSLYCQEYFTLYHEEKKHGSYTFQVELMSRVNTGEFLKIYVDYELTHNFEPLNVRIKRHLGSNKSTERFSVDLKDKKLLYTFNGEGGFKEIERATSGKFHISTPAICTSMVMTHARKIDPVHRTPYEIISSDNIWSYESPYQEATLHIELMKLEPVHINVAGHDLQATHCNIYEMDKFNNPTAQGYPVYLSKHYQIPYLAEFADGIRVEVEELKSFEKDHSELFNDKKS